MAIKQQTFTKTPFKKQAEVIASLLRTNPILNDDEKASLTETVGVLTWINQLQLHWETGATDTPEQIGKHIFEGRKPVKMKPPGTE